MSNSKRLVLLVCAGLLASCSSQASEDYSHADITRVKNLSSEFSAPYTVKSAGPAAIDPRLLGPQKLPPGVTFDPAECGETAQQQNVPADVKGNMAALTAEGDGVRYVAIALETSERVPVPTPSEQCKKVTFSGAGVRGLVEVVEASQIEGVHTVGTHRVLQTITAQVRRQPLAARRPHPAQLHRRVGPDRADSSPTSALLRLAERNRSDRAFQRA